MNRVKAFTIKLVLVLSLFLSFPVYPVKAAGDFEVVTGYDVNYDKGSDYITITESIELVVYNQRYYIPSGTVQNFLLQDYGLKSLKNERDFKLDSLTVRNQYGTSLNFDTRARSNGIELSVPLTFRVDYRNSYKIIVQYKTHELINVNGNIVNIYVPGLSEDTDFSETSDGLTTNYIYNTTITTDKEMPSPSYIQPENITSDEKQDEIVYTIAQEDRLGHTAWMQLGSNQYYYFKIVQKTPKTDNLIPKELSKVSSILSSNVFKIALPREFDENKQKVYFKKITPSPQSIERDNEGNLIATFSVPANEESQIVIEGYITLYKAPTAEKTPLSDITISDYAESLKQADLEVYTEDDTFWETSSSEVSSAAAGLIEGEESLLDLIRKDYSYVVEKFDYDYEKIAAGNPRIGAKEALSGGDTICMEYADALTAILRAQGIAARAAIGYGNDPTGAENRISNDEPLEQTIGHQWVQVWIPEYGWLSVDPTWGESDRTYIGSDLDHILWYTVGDNSKGIAETVVYSSNFVDSSNLEQHSVFIQALDSSSEEEITSHNTSEKLLQQFKPDELVGVSLFLQTTPLGRVLVFLIPITFVTFSAVVLTLLTKAIRKRFLRKAN